MMTCNNHIVKLNLSVCCIDFHIQVTQFVWSTSENSMSSVHKNHGQILSTRIINKFTDTFTRFNNMIITSHHFVFHIPQLVIVFMIGCRYVTSAHLMPIYSNNDWHTNDVLKIYLNIPSTPWSCNKIVNE